ncbi:MAG TPA: hypothetical protein VGF86_15935 [Candidatus Tumulicola sp.]|jgi:hypothetical protein
MAIRNALAGIAVRDFRASLKWYERLLGRAPDARPMQGLAEWEFPAGGWIQVFEDDARAGSASVTLADDDLRTRVADLQDRGIPVVSKSESPEVKIAIVKDLDGNQIVFAQGGDDNHRSTA